MSSVLAVSLLGGCRASDKPVTLTVWTYYNGDQLASFERLVEEFNTTSYSDAHSISIKVLPCQKFADGEAYAVQQGAGMVVTQGSEQEIKALPRDGGMGDAPPEDAQQQGRGGRVSETEDELCGGEGTVHQASSIKSCKKFAPSRKNS